METSDLPSPSSHPSLDPLSQYFFSPWLPLMYGLGIPITLTLLAWALPSRYHCWPRATTSGTSIHKPPSSSSSSSSPHPLILGLLMPLGALSFLLVLTGSWLSWAVQLSGTSILSAVRPLLNIQSLRETWTRLGLWMYRLAPRVRAWVRYPGHLMAQLIPWLQWGIQVGGYTLLLLLHHLLLPTWSFLRASLGSWTMAWSSLRVSLLWCLSCLIGLAIHSLVALHLLFQFPHYLPSLTSIYTGGVRGLVAAWVFWIWRVHVLELFLPLLAPPLALLINSHTWDHLKFSLSSSLLPLIHALHIGSRHLLSSLALSFPRSLSLLIHASASMILYWTRLGLWACLSAWDHTHLTLTHTVHLLLSHLVQISPHLPNLQGASVLRALSSLFSLLSSSITRLVGWCMLGLDTFSNHLIPSFHSFLLWSHQVKVACLDALSSLLVLMASSCMALFSTLGHFLGSWTHWTLPIFHIPSLLISSLTSSFHAAWRVLIILWSHTLPSLLHLLSKGLHLLVALAKEVWGGIIWWVYRAMGIPYHYPSST
ncbi:MAG: hypothetical protein DHS80DRAFT_20885 [Piptocephalis tieghemiana]|nr:MAG: hypothetical protein DHS80DRAFT_20885 [Piptocephalis tieghemiana]